MDICEPTRGFMGSTVWVVADHLTEGPKDLPVRQTEVSVLLVAVFLA